LRLYTIAAAFLLTLSLLLLSCASPAAVSAFAQSAQNGINDGPPLFNDLYSSCVRRETLRPDLQIYPEFVPSGSKQAAPKDNSAIASCSRFNPASKELDKMSDVLSSYFKSLQQLAGFNTAAVAGSAEAVGQNAATAAGLSYTQIESAGKLASLITQLATEGYQTSRLVKYVHDADPEIADLTSAFERATRTYLDLLDQEQQTVTALYQTVGEGSMGSMLFLLNHAYHQDIDKLQERRAGAMVYAGLLKDIREGHHKLVADGKNLSAKELMVTLAPYTSKINGALAELPMDKQPSQKE
jgi:hypothetical protein